MLLRTFPLQIEQLARQWRAEVLTPWTWSQVGDFIPAAESRPFLVRSTQGASGLAKPGTHEPSVREHARAAHEKIAADLAFDLGLPVPPVVLWEQPRGSHRPTSPRHVSISALAFPRATPWKRVSSLDAKRLIPRLASAASAMVVFDSWIANTDNQNSANLMLSEDVSVSPSLLRTAYVDFANSLSYLWAKEMRWKREEGVALFPTGIVPSPEVMEATLQGIERFPSEALHEIVSRIPESFLSKSQRDIILEGLVHRRSTVRKMMASYLEVS